MPPCQLGEHREEEPPTTRTPPHKKTEHDKASRFKWEKDSSTLGRF